MKEFKYHIITFLSVGLFSYILAVTINNVVRYSISPLYKNEKQRHNEIMKTGTEELPDFSFYNSIIESGFFKIAEDEPVSDNIESIPEAESSDLRLYGTISGPKRIARAIIKKKTARRSRKGNSGSAEKTIFRIGDEVYGYKLVRIDGCVVYLKYNNEITKLDMYAKDEFPQNDTRGKTSSVNTAGNNITISRSEVQQKVFNNMDNALKGLRAGPYRKKGNIEGYKLFRVSPANILYKFGARTGDIIKRINGHKLDSTQKLISLWDSVKSENRVTVDIDRRGSILNYEINITN